MTAHHLNPGPVTSDTEAGYAASYNALLLADPSLARGTRDTLVQAQNAHGLRFNERLICAVLRPRFFTRARFRELTRVSEILADVFERAGEVLLGSESLLDLIDASEAERELWAVDPGYARFSVTSRLDTFMIGETPYVVEYNAESPASMGFCDLLTEIFHQVPAMQGWRAASGMHGFVSRRGLTDALVDSWKEWGGRGTPTIAIIDWEHVPTRRDFELCAEYFREQGMTTIIVDPRSFEYRNGKLWHDDLHIDLVYRRVLLHELLDHSAEAQPLLQAYRDGAICMVNSARSKILHKKAVMGLLSEGALNLPLSEEEQAVIQRSIPWTRRLVPGKTAVEGGDVDLVEYVLAHRDDLVLKPSDDYGGRGVVLGWEVSADAWERAIESAIGQPYVVQMRVPVAQGDFPTWGDDRLEIVSLMLDTDPLLFMGQVGGILTRTSGSPLLNVTAGAGSTAPTFLLENEE